MAADNPFRHIEDAHTLAQAIVDTIHEPLLVLDQDMCVIEASRSFYATFKVTPDDTRGRLLYALGDGQWDIVELRLLLEKIVPERGVMDDYEVRHEFPGIGLRDMLLNARKIFYEHGSHTTVLLAIEDITERRAAERTMKSLLDDKDMLLQEMEHRVANSLQIIASILSMKARSVQSSESRLHLQEAHQRVMSIASVQKQLHRSGVNQPIEVEPYLTKLCEALSGSMISESRPITLQVRAEGIVASSSEAVSVGLIVTELVINAIKHAFLDEQKAGVILVCYDVMGTNWNLSVADDGVGRPPHTEAKPGLGTSIVAALAKQLDARMDVVTSSKGTTVTVSHATFASLKPQLTTASRPI